MHTEKNNENSYVKLHKSTPIQDKKPKQQAEDAQHIVNMSLYYVKSDSSWASFLETNTLYEMIFKMAWKGLGKYSMCFQLSCNPQTNEWNTMHKKVLVWPGAPKKTYCKYVVTQGETKHMAKACPHIIHKWAAPPCSVYEHELVYVLILPCSTTYVSEEEHLFRIEC